MTLLGFLDTLVLIIHIVVCLFLVGIVLIQGGKGASLSASFGMGGSSSSAFGARTDSFMTKMTSGAAIAFVITSVGLTFLASRTGSLSQTINVEDRAGSSVTSTATDAVPAEGVSPEGVTPEGVTPEGGAGTPEGTISETAPAVP